MGQVSALARPLSVLAALLVLASNAGGAQIAGDQLLFFYDGRAGRVPFFGVSNPSPDAPVTVEVVFYPESLQGRLGQLSTTLPPLGHTVIDPTSAANGVAIGNAGLAVVTPVAPGTSRPVVPPTPLVGTFTLANVPLESAFGENPIGRRVTTASGSRPDPGTAVDGTTVSYERLRPSTLLVPVSNPQELGPVAQDGNRVVLVAFTDEYGSTFDVGPHADRVEATIFDAAGSALAETQIEVQGVHLTNLQAVASPSQLSTSGKVFFEVDAGPGNVFGIFSQSLGAFGAGQRMPAVFDTPTPATALEEGATSGDQLLFFFDGRSGRVPFLSVANPSSSSGVTVEVAFYSQSLERRLGIATLALPAAGHAVIDPNQAANGATIGNVGLAVVTAVRPGSSEPIVPPEPLVGTFTLANVPLESAFGENPIGRLAVSASGDRAPGGSGIDGDSVAFQRLTPETLVVPVFFNPTQLGPVENDGNRVVVVAFLDQYGDRFDVRPHGNTASATIFDGEGTPLSSKQVSVQSVHLTNAQALASPVSLDSSGKIFLELDAGNGNVFGLFSQSLGPFGAGQRMPAVAVGPLPTPKPQRTATPNPDPTAEPTATPAPTNGPTPAPDGTPTPPAATPSPTASPAPTASPSPIPSPTAGFTVLGIPQASCRNGFVDAGEECDAGTGNFECSKDPEYQSLCGPGSPQGWNCAYCATTYTIGSPDIQPPPCGGSSRLVTVQPLAERVCSTIGQGTVASCSIPIGGSTAQTLCPVITSFVTPFGDPDTLVEGFRQAKCTSTACVPLEDLVGDCGLKAPGESCRLQVGGSLAMGNCQPQRSGLSLCLGPTVDLS